MRNMLSFIAALTLTFIGVGLYLDWFQIRTVTPHQGRRTVNIDINTEKITEDLGKGGEYLLEEGGAKIQDLLEKRRKENTSVQTANEIHGPPYPPENR